MSVNSYRGIPKWSEVKDLEWNDWKWQLRNSITNIANLNTVLSAFTDSRVAASPVVDHVSRDLFAFKVSPYMVMNLKEALDQNIKGAWSAFSGSFIPTEFEATREEASSVTRIDGIGEDLKRSHPAPGITRFYSNRVLLRMTHMCGGYCRYCFRRRFVGDGGGAWSQNEIDSSLDFIRAEKSVSEVILSGGDPLILADDRLKYVLEKVSVMDHIRRVRIDTKMLTMIPQRITADFVKAVRVPKLAAIVAHFTHVSELGADVMRATASLLDAGIPIYAHIPLLHNVNDDEVELHDLVERLVDLRIRPYYLIQFIPTDWTEHFRVSLGRGLQLLEYLQKHCTGLAVPTYIVYLPSGHGKVPFGPAYFMRRSDVGYVFRAHDGSEVLYREPMINGNHTNGSE